MSRGRLVLVVDDDPLIRSFMAMALEDEGYGVETAANGAEALERARANCPDAIVLDLMMPVLDGWSFLGACRQEAVAQDVPILVVSAAHPAASAEELGVSAVLRKPFNLDVMLRTLEGLLP